MSLNYKEKLQGLSPTYSLKPTFPSSAGLISPEPAKLRVKQILIIIF